MATIIGPHDFHTDTPVIAVETGTLAKRENGWREHGWNHGSNSVREATAGDWAEVYRIMAEAYEAKEGRKPGAFTSLFYIVKEGNRTSCGCIELHADRGVYHFTG